MKKLSVFFVCLLLFFSLFTVSADDLETESSATDSSVQTEESATTDSGTETTAASGTESSVSDSEMKSDAMTADQSSQISTVEDFDINKTGGTTTSAVVDNQKLTRRYYDAKERLIKIEIWNVADTVIESALTRCILYSYTDNGPTLSFSKDTDYEAHTETKSKYDTNGNLVKKDTYLLQTSKNSVPGGDAQPEQFGQSEQPQPESEQPRPEQSGQPGQPEPEPEQPGQSEQPQPESEQPRPEQSGQPGQPQPEPQPQPQPQPEQPLYLVPDVSDMKPFLKVSELYSYDEKERIVSSKKTTYTYSGKDKTTAEHVTSLQYDYNGKGSSPDLKEYRDDTLTKTITYTGEKTYLQVLYFENNYRIETIYDDGTKKSERFIQDGKVIRSTSYEE